MADTTFLSPAVQFDAAARVRDGDEREKGAELPAVAVADAVELARAPAGEDLREQVGTERLAAVEEEVACRA